MFFLIEIDFKIPFVIQGFNLCLKNFRETGFNGACFCILLSSVWKIAHLHLEQSSIFHLNLISSDHVYINLV